MNYYNEFDPFAAQWLRNLMARNLIPQGEVDERSITEVHPDDLIGFRQCHFFGGWALAARLAGWSDDRELWTGSPPCQPFSVAGKGLAQADDRHLWPHYLRLIRARRPVVCMGEQVAAAVGKDWLDGVADDLEGIGYACGAAVVPACAVNAPHRRDRLWFVADAMREGSHAGTYAGVHPGEEGAGARHVGAPGLRHPRSDWTVADAGGGRCGEPGEGQVQQPWRAEIVGAGAARNLADANGIAGRQGNQDAGGCQDGSGTRQVAGFECAGDGAVAHTESLRREGRDLRADFGVPSVGVEKGCIRATHSAWDHSGWIIGHDGKARRVEPSIRLLAHGVSGRVGRLRAYGNAIVPQVAAEVIGAYLDCYPTE